MFGRLIRTAVDVASLPVAIVKDIVTLNENDQTEKKVEDIQADVGGVIDDIFGD